MNREQHAMNGNTSSTSLFVPDDVMMLPSDTEMDTSHLFSGEESPMLAVDEDTLMAMDTAEQTDTLASGVSSTADVPPAPVAPRPKKRRRTVALP
eukprot:4784044-Amphidinium_carterae.1